MRACDLYESVIQLRERVLSVAATVREWGLNSFLVRTKETATSGMLMIHVDLADVLGKSSLHG